MGAIQLTEELHRAIERQVADGRAASPAAFVEEAVLRLLHDAEGERRDVLTAVEAGSADLEAGRYITVSTAEDEQTLRERLMARLQARMTTGE